jgi:hypothetical protein
MITYKQKEEGHFPNQMRIIMATMKFKMTRHAKVERIDRLSACVTILGVGEVILETVFEESRLRLTDTGLCLVVDRYEEKLITGYMCPIHRCTAMYKSMGYARVPHGIYNTVVKNCKKYPHLLQM